MPPRAGGLTLTEVVFPPQVHQRRCTVYALSDNRFGGAHNILRDRNAERLTSEGVVRQNTRTLKTGDSEPNELLADPAPPRSSRIRQRPRGGYHRDGRKM
jgi:hypothetical protein